MVVVVAHQHVEDHSSEQLRAIVLEILDTLAKAVGERAIGAGCRCSLVDRLYEVATERANHIPAYADAGEGGDVAGLDGARTAARDGDRDCLATDFPELVYLYVLRCSEARRAVIGAPLPRELSRLRHVRRDRPERVASAGDDN